MSSSRVLHCCFPAHHPKMPQAAPRVGIAPRGPLPPSGARTEAYAAAADDVRLSEVQVI